MKPASLPEATAHSGGLAVGVVVAAGVVAALHVGKAPIATPLLQSGFGIDLGMAGWLTAVFALLGLFGGIPAATLVSAAGDRRMLNLGLLIIAAGAAIGALAPVFSILLASRILEGLGFLLVTVAGPAVLQRVVNGSRRDAALALWSCFMPAGMALAMLVGPFFTEWRSLWWATGSLAIAILGLSALTVPTGRMANRIPWRAVLTDALAVFGQKGPVLLATCFALYSLMFFALFSFLPVLLMERMGVAHGTAGLLSALASGVNMIGNLAAGYCLAASISRSRLIAIAGLAMGISGLGIFLPGLPNAGTFLLCLLFSAVGGLIPATLLASAPLVARPAGLMPAVVGLLMQGSNLGQVTGPIAIGGAIGALGWPAAAGAVLTAALGILAVARASPTNN
jgi:predicted MFS family arabinose efflux permease